MVASLAGLSFCLNYAAHAKTPWPVEEHLVHGWCRDGSYNALGPPGSDLSRSHSPFHCDAATILVDAKNRRLAITFSTLHDNTGPAVTFGGHTDRDGVEMQVEIVNRGDGEPAAAEGDKCRFIFSGPTLAGIVCQGFAEQRGVKSSTRIKFEAYDG